MRIDIDTNPETNPYVKATQEYQKGERESPLLTEEEKQQIHANN